MKLEKIQILILQFDLFLASCSDNKRLAVVSENEIRGDGGKFSR